MYSAGNLGPLLNLLFEQAPTFMALLRGPEHRFELANPRYMDLVGHREILGKTVAEALPDAHAQGFVDILDEVYRSGLPYTAVGAAFVAQSEPGGPVSERFLDFVYQPVRDEEGTVGAIFVEGADVTERVLAERMRRDSETLYKELFDAIDLGFCVIEFFDGPHGPNSDYIHIAANAAYAKHAGIPNVVGQKLREMVPAEADAWVARYGAVLASGEQVRFQQELVATGRFLDLAAIRIEPSSRRQVAVLFQDITARRRAEIALEELNAGLEEEVASRSAKLLAAEEALRHSYKMEAVGQLTGGLAHDFNNILAGISGSLEIMGKRLSQGRTGEIDRYINDAMSATKRAAGLTQRLLAFSRRQTLDPTPLRVETLVDGMRELVRRTVGPHIALSIETMPEVWTTCVDAGQLENALLNLCINARDAMPRGGRMVIGADNVVLDRRVETDDALPPGDYVRLSVSDTGSGMAPDVMLRAFDPFYTTKPAGQGTGLGLSMVYGFAGQSGGTARIQSQAGQGTTVSIYLPRFDGDARDDVLVKVDGGIPSEQTASKTVLVVDDEALIRMMTVEHLQDLGFTVLEADDGRSALQILESDVNIGLLVSDVGLPGGMNGRQLAEAARSARPGLRVLFITGYAEHAVLNHAELEQGMEILTKPFQLDVLSERVAQILAA